jgi:hypothetical protein
VFPYPLRSAPLKFSPPIELPYGQLILGTDLFDTIVGNTGTMEIPMKVAQNSTAP